MRVKFRKGFQRKFIDKIIMNTNSPSLSKLIQFGLKVNYQTLKSYYNENRTLPEDLFNDLCILGKIDAENVKVRVIHEHWGQKLGGSR
jgi:hypothetical protein